MLKKIGANTELLVPAIKDKFDDIDAVFRKYTGVEGVITSGNDGRHMVGSLHYRNKAIDLRIWYVSKSKLEPLVDDLKEVMGKDFDVILESDHIHLEYDPKF